MNPFQIALPHKSFRLYPFGDIHWGSPNCNQSFVRQVVAEIEADPQAKVVLMGDLAENAVLGSKSDVYMQVIHPQKQVEEICELLDPIKKKILFAVDGNHEYRTFKLTGIDLTQVIAHNLGIPAMGYSCLARFILDSRTPRSFMCYFHHSYGGGATPGGKVNRAKKLRDIVPQADAIFSGHTHITSRIPSVWYDLTMPGNTGNGQIVERVGYDYIIGSALSYSGSYAEAHAMPPACCEMMSVEFFGATTGKRDNRKQIMRIISPEE